MMKGKKYILKRNFHGFPKESDVEIVEEELSFLKDNEFLAKALYISVDPYMRCVEQQVGNVLMGYQIAKIIESKAEDYPVDKYVLADFGWRTYTISTKLHAPGGILPDFGNLPPSLGLGILGMPGNTAYFGFLEVCKPQKGETVAVSAAGGAIGTHVGQIAKIMGCKVIGILGDDTKGKYVTEELGFDHYINYKTKSIKEELKKLAPEGIDCYFDNVGGEISSTVINLMNMDGRICCCGFISQYNKETDELPKVTSTDAAFIFKRLRMEGIIVNTWYPRWNEGIKQNLKWIQEGRLKYKETITEGFDNVVQALTDMLQGKNVGKAIVKL